MSDFARYLLAKRTVDDRALNLRVWDRLRREVRKPPVRLLRIADVGAGLGTGAERIAAWQLFEPLSAVRYTGVEPRGSLLDEARGLRTLPFPAELAATTLEEFSRESRGAFDLVVAHALLDIVPLPPALTALAALARPGGLLYFPITFDGETIFEPASGDDLAVLSAYHETMEEKGSSRTGRRLFHALRSLSIEVLEVGSSDWIVHPTATGYPGDEAYFLEFLLRTIESAVHSRVDRACLDAWLAERHRQLASNELFYCAHQVDLLARRP
jgi:SAM-dependent methyltransferase